MKEIWKDIPGYNGLYKASRTGEIKSVFRRMPVNPTGVNKSGFFIVNERILIPRPDNKGYGRVILYKDLKRTQFKIHYLILITFSGPKPSPTHQCRHLDGNNKNNKISNLKWGTPKENSADNIKHGKTLGHSMPGENSPMAKLTNKDVRRIRTLSSLGWRPTRLAREFNISQPNISMIVNYKRWKHI